MARFTALEPTDAAKGSLGRDASPQASHFKSASRRGIDGRLRRAVPTRGGPKDEVLW